MNSEEFFAQRLKEMQKEERKKFDDALRQQKPINLGPTTTIGMETYLGDEIILRLTAQDAIRQYSRAHGFPTPVFVYDSEQSVATYQGKKDYYRAHHLTTLSMHEPQSILEKAVIPYKEALDMRDYRPHIPPLEKIDGHPYLGTFSREKVDRYKTKIQEAVPHPFTAIVQTGSSPVKRWSPEQLFLIAKTAAENPQLPKPIILSDAKISRNTKDAAQLEHLAKEHGVPVYFFEDIEELTAYMGLADVVASTDSAPVWVWEAEKKTESRALVHHTITNKYWKAPSADAVYSKMVREGKEVRGGYVDNGLDGYAKTFGVDKDSVTAPARADLVEYCVRLLKYK